MKKHRKSAIKPSSNPYRKSLRPLGYYEVVPLDATEVKRKYLQQWKKKQHELEKHTAAWEKYCEEERPAFERWMHMTFGPKLADIRSSFEKIREKSLIISQIEELSGYTGINARRLYQNMLKQVKKGQSLLDAIFTYRLELQEEQQKSYGSFHDREDRDGDNAKADENIDDDEEFDEFIESLDELLSISEDDNNESISLGLSEEERRVRIRTCYRDLCLKLHPDSGGKFNPETERLWHQVQHAYETRDLERLETIQSGMEIKLDPMSPRVSCSQLLDLCKDAEARLSALKLKIKEEKSDPAWNFNTWTEKQRKKAINSLKNRFTEEQHQMQYEMLHLTKIIAKWDKPYNDKNR